jgi:paraquat-inducible protein B
MNNENTIEDRLSEIKNVEMKDPKGISMVWLLPILAVLIAGWLGYKAYSEIGPTITISFKEATGIEAGKTKIKFKDVEIGTVDDVTLSDDLSGVLVTASLRSEAKKYLKENTQFWVVRPRIGAGGISGLSTLFSGAYIEIEPGDGAKKKQFAGLEVPPVITAEVKGRSFILHSDSIGSLDAGSPIYYEGIHAGEIISYKFSPDSNQIILDIFVQDPFHDLVKENTRFWNVSGVEVLADTDGVDIKTGSLQSIILGGIAFESYGDKTIHAKVANEDATFTLYDRYGDIADKQYKLKVPYVMFFKGSVRGLSVGAPVDFRGIKVGSVTKIQIVGDPKTQDIYIPVTIAIEPQRVKLLANATRSPRENIAKLVKRGLKAQLQTGNLLTGELYVDLDLHPEAETKLAGIKYEHPELPTIPTAIAEVKETLTKLAADIRKMPLDEIAQNILETTQGMNHLVNDPDMKKIPHSTNAALVQATKTLHTVDGVIEPDSPLQYDLATMLVEFKEAARSIRILSDYLEQHPETLIAGKK